MRKLKKFPEVFYEVKLDKILSTIELEKVKEGKYPKGMDDRWIIYFQEPWLYFHRSWTGICIYKLHVILRNSESKIDKLLVNGDVEQYLGEEENEGKYFAELLDFF